MKKTVFMVCATLVVSAATIVGVKVYNYYSMPELMKANLEALSTDENTGGQLRGDCAKDEGGCIYQCPRCGGKWGKPSEMGPVKTIYGTCDYLYNGEKCGYEINYKMNR